MQHKSMNILCFGCKSHILRGEDAVNKFLLIVAAAALLYGDAES